MSSKLWEWTHDGFDYYSASPVTDPSGDPSATRRALRGGSWYNEARFARVSSRGNFEGNSYGNSLGIRVLRTAP